MPAVNNVSGSSNVYLEALGSSKVALSPGSIMMLLRRHLGDADGQIDGMMQQIESNTARSETLQRRMEGLTMLKSALATAQENAPEDHQVTLDELEIQWEGRPMNGAELLNSLGITDLPANGYSPPDQEQIDTARTQLAGLEEYAHRDGFDSVAEAEAVAQRVRSSPSGRAQTSSEADALHLADTAQRFRNTISQGTTGYTGSEVVNMDALDGVISTVQSQSRRMNSGNEVLMVQMQSAMQQRSQAVTLATQMMKSLNDTSNAVARNIGS